MKRRAFNVLAALSLLLFLPTVAVWVRGYFAADRWYWPDPDQIWQPSLHPAIIYTDGHILWQAPTDEEIYAYGLAIHGNVVVNLAPGAIEYVIDSPPLQQVKPAYALHGLKPGSFRGDADASLKSPMTVVHWSLFGFTHEEVSGRTFRSELSSILPRSRVHPVLVRRWTVPYWPLAMITGVLPLLWMMLRIKRRRRDRAGLCHDCGYDLRATPERCPECGTAAAPAR